MESRPYISLRRQGVSEYLIVLGIIFLAAGVRFYHSFHFLLSDEAYNLMAIEVLAATQDLHFYFFKHPPLYLIVSALGYYMFGPNPQVPAYISVIFSALSLIPLYLIVKDIMGRRTALWAAVFLAFMPGNVFYSTWIKQEGMLLFLFLWGLCFFLKRRFVLAGLSIGLALLVKEFALFFFPLSFFIALIEHKKERWLDAWRGWIITLFISVGIAGWWYVLHGGWFYLIAGEAMTGAYVIEWYWHYPWWFFLRNLIFDLYYPTLPFFMAGLALMFINLYKEGFKQSHYVFPLWLASFYLPLSLLHMKTPWFIYLATPALAVVVAYGMIGLLDRLHFRSARLVVYLALLACIIFILPAFDHLEYNSKVTGVETREVPVEILLDIQGATWSEMAQNRTLWRERMEGIAGKVAFLQYSPTLHYLMGIDDSRVYRIKVSNFIYIGKEGLERLVSDKGIGLFILFDGSLTYTEKNLEDMIYLWGEPDRVGSLILFNTKK